MPNPTSSRVVTPASGMLDVVELDRVKLKLVPLPSSDQVAGVSSNAMAPLPCTVPVPLNAIAVRPFRPGPSTCPLVRERRSNEKVSPPNETVHSGITDPLSKADTPSPLNVKLLNVADVLNGT